MSAYFLPICSPIILQRFWISGFSPIYFVRASRTFKNLPLSGKHPNLSLPMTSIPASASDLAESPSVKMIVHSCELRVPAKFASSNFGIPSNFDFFWPGPKALAIFASSLACATFRTRSTTPLFSISFKNFSLSSYLLPKPETLVFKFSFV